MCSVRLEGKNSYLLSSKTQVKFAFFLTSVEVIGERRSRGSVLICGGLEHRGSRPVQVSKRERLQLMLLGGWGTGLGRSIGVYIVLLLGVIWAWSTHWDVLCKGRTSAWRTSWRQWEELATDQDQCRYLEAAVGHSAVSANGWTWPLPVGVYPWTYQGTFEHLWGTGSLLECCWSVKENKQWMDSTIIQGSLVIFDAHLLDGISLFDGTFLSS